MIDQQYLLTQLQNLEKQRQDAQATLHKIEGAEQMVRHMLARAAQPDAQRNGLPAQGEPVQG